MGLKNEEELTGKGVSYCCTCVGAFYQDKIVGVVGGKLIKREEELSLMLANSVEVLDSVSELRKWLEGFVEKK